MAVAISRPATSGASRSDDVRALKFRIRDLTFSGNYATGGEVVTAASLGLSAILYVTPMNVITGVDAGGVTGTVPTFNIASNGTSVTIRQLEDAAAVAGLPFGQEKTNAEAYVANSVHRILFIGV